MFTKTSFPSQRAVTSGLIAGTLVEGPMGWVPVEDLRIGDAVHSYDGGLVRVLGMDRNWLPPTHGGYLVQLPGGMLDNCSDLMLLPGQTILMDTLNDPDLPDDIVVLIPASVLESHLGATRHRIENPWRSSIMMSTGRSSPRSQMIPRPGPKKFRR